LPRISAVRLVARTVKHEVPHFRQQDRVEVNLGEA